MDESLTSDIDRWIETARKCQYLPEKDLKVSYIHRSLFNAHLCVLSEIVWHSVWSFAGRVECSASVYTCYCVWWYPWPGKTWLVAKVAMLGGATGGHALEPTVQSGHTLYMSKCLHHVKIFMVGMYEMSTSFSRLAHPHSQDWWLQNSLTRLF